jgi:hypothetical protein
MVLVTGMGFGERWWDVLPGVTIGRMTREDQTYFNPVNFMMFTYRVGAWFVPDWCEESCFRGIIIQRTCLKPYQNLVEGQSRPPPPRNLLEQRLQGEAGYLQSLRIRHPVQ